MTLRKKLLTCLLFLGLVIAALVTSAFVDQRRSEAATEAVLSGRLLPLHELNQISDLYAKGVVDVGHQIRNDNIPIAEGAKMVRANRAKIEQHWSAYRANELEADERALANEMEAAITRADKDLDTLQTILDRGDRAGLDGWETETFTAIQPISEVNEKLVNLQIQKAQQISTDTLKAMAVSFAIILALMAAAAAVVVLSFFIITRKVAQPIQGLAATINGLARETSDATVPHLDQKDEIGDIARAVDAFRTSVVEKERIRAAEAAKIQEQVTSALAGGLSALAGGDLTCQLTVDFPPAYEGLKADFNTAVAALHEAITAINGSVANLHGGSAEISQAAEDLSRRTEQQAASIEQTAAAMTEITATVRNNATGAKDAADLVQKTRTEAGEGEKVVAAAVEAMSAIERSSQEITKIIAVIDKIAFQTNLLALNASVEAAHAGEAGQAFAVVANEVRALAQRSADAASEIGQLISGSSEQVGAGVGLVNESGKALERIVAQVHEVSTLVGQIASASEQQSDALNQVGAAVGEMDKMTQQNAAMVEESTAAARSLADEATGLTQLVAKFDTGEQKRPAAAKPQRKGPRPVPMVRGNTALALQTQVAEAVDDWNEF